MQKEATYDDLDEARDLVCRAAARYRPDPSGRKQAAIQLMKALVSLPSGGLTITTEGENIGFANSNCTVALKLEPQGAKLFTVSSRTLAGKEIEGLEYNPVTKLLDGPLIKGTGTTFQTSKRRGRRSRSGNQRAGRG